MRYYLLILFNDYYYYLPLTTHQLMELCKTRSGEPKGLSFSLCKFHIPHSAQKIALVFENQ